MTFEQANDIIGRRYGYHMATIPTEEEVEEAEKAFGLDKVELCLTCSRCYACHMYNPYTTHCNFFTEDKHGKH